jgi:hypothetical protein
LQVNRFGSAGSVICPLNLRLQTYWYAAATDAMCH